MNWRRVGVSASLIYLLLISVGGCLLVVVHWLAVPHVSSLVVAYTVVLIPGLVYLVYNTLLRSVWWLLSEVWTMRHHPKAFAGSSLLLLVALCLYFLVIPSTTVTVT
jgi:hypothetical protein